MSTLPKALFCWSGGKDSSYCLHKVLSEKQFDVVYLMTTVNDAFKRISMHGVREELLDKQIESIGIPAIKVRIKDGTHAEYEELMRDTLLRVKAEGVTHVIFGDIFLEDLRSYREENLKKVDLLGVFPLWKMDTKALIQDFIAKQFKTITCCINDGYLEESWVGKEIDTDFVNELPAFVDPCGENGEYHTFCYDGPVFKTPITFTVGEKIYKPLEYQFDDDVCKSPIKTKGFWYCDLISV
ncbi:diphthine--ammonia ligase [Cytophaga aurantiaca]|uniref:Dph6-related ATP pyrophosphatase n=1 Tax=Cytophaga aurantiaca TaxID=29530 RepID=UPI001FE21345|nr:diphthine--ammonia ligase [Cytophaga aurantiaca]